MYKTRVVYREKIAVLAGHGYYYVFCHLEDKGSCACGDRMGIQRNVMRDCVWFCLQADKGFRCVESTELTARSSIQSSIIDTLENVALACRWYKAMRLVMEV